MSDIGTEPIGGLPRLTFFQKVLQASGDLVVIARGAAMGPILFYYSTILGVPASIVGLALGITVTLDAISDPLIGAWSDNVRTKLGRRHPFMYASIIPLGLGIYALLIPPDGLGDWGMFAWILSTTIVINLAYTAFSVPYAALLAELTDDYDERTEIIAYRGFFNVGGIALFWMISYGIIFTATEDYPQGQFNPDGYPVLAMVCATVAVLAAIISTHFTRDRIKLMRVPPPPKPISLGNMFLDVKDALSNRNFRLLFLGALSSGIIDGADKALEGHMLAFFWTLTAEEIFWLALIMLGSIVGLFLAKPLQRKFEKRTIFIWGVVVLIVAGMFMVLGRFADIIPENNTTGLLVLFISTGIVRVTIATVVGILIASMIGDVVNEHEYRTGRRQGGVMFSGLGFADKAVAGLGLALGGVALDLIGLPRGVSSGFAADPDTIFWLGMTAGIIFPVLKLLPLIFMFFYHLPRDEYSAMAEALNEGAVREGQAIADGQVVKEPTPAE